MKPVIGYTLGDQSGIGPEVISAALASGELPEGAEYRLIGKRVQVPLGRPNAESAKHAFDHLEQAAHALREGTVDAVVTAPVCKETLHEASFRWPGQTEFFAERLDTGNYVKTSVKFMLDILPDCITIWLDCHKSLYACIITQLSFLYNVCTAATI